MNQKNPSSSVSGFLPLSLKDIHFPCKELLFRMWERAEPSGIPLPVLQTDCTIHPVGKADVIQGKKMYFSQAS